MPPFNSGATTKSTKAFQRQFEAAHFAQKRPDLRRQPVLRMKEVFSIGAHDFDAQLQNSTGTDSLSSNSASQKSANKAGQPLWKPDASTLKQLEATNTLTPQSLFERFSLSKQLRNLSASAEELRAKKKEALKSYLRVQTHLNVEKGQYGAVSGFPDMKALMPNLIEMNANYNRLGLHHVAKFNCTILRLSSNFITDEVIERDLEFHKLISQAPGKFVNAHLFSTLRILDISNNLIEDFYMLCELFSKFSLLQTVILSNNNLSIPTSELAKPKVTVESYLKSDPPTHNLPPYDSHGYVISLGEGSSGPSQAQHSNIPVVASVTTLVMDGIPMTPSFFFAIAKAFPNLEMLSLRGCDISYTILSSLLELPKIVELDVSNNPKICNLDHLKSYALHAPGKNLSFIQAHNSVGIISRKEGPTLYLWLDFENNLIGESRNPYFRPENTFRTIEISLFQNSGIQQALRSGDVAPIKIETSFFKTSVACKNQGPSELNSDINASFLQKLSTDLEILGSTDLDAFNQEVTIQESVLDNVTIALENFRLISDDTRQQDEDAAKGETRHAERTNSSRSNMPAKKSLSSYLVTTADTMYLPKPSKLSSRRSSTSKGSTELRNHSRCRKLGSNTWKSTGNKSGFSIAAILGGIGAPADTIVAAPTLRLSAPSINRELTEGFSNYGPSSIPSFSVPSRTCEFSKSLSPKQKSPPRAPMYKRPDSTRRNLILGSGETAVDSYLTSVKTKYATNEIVMRALASVRLPHEVKYPNFYDAAAQKLSSFTTSGAIDELSSSSALDHKDACTPINDAYSKPSIGVGNEDQSPLSVYKLYLHSEDRKTFDKSSSVSRSINNQHESRGLAVQDMDLTDETLMAEMVASFVRASISGRLNKSAPANLHHCQLSLFEDVEDMSNSINDDLIHEGSKTVDLVKHEDIFTTHSFSPPDNRGPMDLMRARSAPPRQALSENMDLEKGLEHSVSPAPTFVGTNTFLTGMDYIQEISDIQEEPPLVSSPAPGIFDDTALTQRIRRGIEQITGPVDVAGIIRSESPRQKDIISFLPRGYRSSLRDVYLALRMVLENPITTYAAIADEEILTSLLQQVN